MGDGGTIFRVLKRSHMLGVGILITAGVILGAVDPSHALSVGDRVQVRPTGQMAVNNAAAGGVIGSQRGVQPSNAPGVLIAGPVLAKIGTTTLTWWEVNFDTGVDGWVAENGLVKAPVKPPAKITLNAVPFTTVGRPGDCGLPDENYPAGAKIVTAVWLKGMGLPDNGGDNVDRVGDIDPRNNPNKADPHFGLLLSKNGTTEDCSVAGAEITGVSKLKLTAPLVLGFDFRNGSHCGPFSPRFEVVVLDAGVEKLHSFACADGTRAQAEQDPTQWTEVRFDTSKQGSPPITAGATVLRITLIHDEGTNLPTFETDPVIGNPAGIGLTVIDNIFIDGTLITRDDHTLHGHTYKRPSRKP